MQSSFTSQTLDRVMAVGILVALGGSFWMPQASWPTTIVVFCVLMGLSVQGHRPADEQRRQQRHRAWLAPAILLVMALQIYLTASNAERGHAMLLSAILVVCAAVLAAYWRRDARSDVSS